MCGPNLRQGQGEEYEPNIHGGYQHIIPAEWAEWDYLNAQWQMRRRLKYRR
jgi:hypothetical protein